MDTDVARPTSAIGERIFYDRLRPLAETYAHGRPVRRVAVIGNQPLGPSAERVAAIDSADLVFRVNGFRLDADEDAPTFGRRADIVVFNRGVRPTPWFFADYPSRLYLLIEPGRMHWEWEQYPDFWPEDLGFVTIPNREVIIPLNQGIGLDALRDGLWATTGTTMAWIAAELFPEAEIVASGFSFVAEPDQAAWDHAYGDPSPVGPEHRISNEARLFQRWLDDGRLDYFE